MVPVVLLTGFLGSGKTSLLNRLLAESPPVRGKMAIIVNEFGDVGIDGDLLPRGLARQVELPGGCICCALDQDLERTVLDLLAREPALEMILIETTGVAEPLPIAWTLGAEALREAVRLGAVVTVVDALEHERNRGHAPAVDAQVEYADLLVLSKLDLAEPSPSLLDALRQCNPQAPILAEPPEMLAAALWLALRDPEEPARIVSSDVPAHRHEAAAVPQGAESSSSSADATDQRAAVEHPITSIALSIPGVLDFEELSAELEALPASYLRIKGIAEVVDHSTGSATPRLIAFHRVGARVSCGPLPSGTVPHSRLVALGKDMDPARLAACVERAVLRSRAGADGN
jgi:G3E family GTPase